MSEFRVEEGEWGEPVAEWVAWLPCELPSIKRDPDKGQLAFRGFVQTKLGIVGIDGATHHSSGERYTNLYAVHDGQALSKRVLGWPQGDELIAICRSWLALSGQAA